MIDNTFIYSNEYVLTSCIKVYIFQCSIITPTKQNVALSTMRHKQNNKKKQLKIYNKL